MPTFSAILNTALMMELLQTFILGHSTTICFTHLAQISEKKLKRDFVVAVVKSLDLTLFSVHLPMSQ